MICNIKQNSNGEYIVRADNGQPSILFKHLKETLNSTEEALEKWAETRTPEFNAAFPRENSYLDDNGEHSMLYVIPQNEILYYGKKDQASSAKAKDKINRQELLEEARIELETQAKILSNTILGSINQFKIAESTGSRNNRYIDVANGMSRLLRDNPDSVKAITEFANYGSYYLTKAKERLDTLKSSQDTNERLETLNELSQLLVIFGNLERFNNLTGTYEKSFFQVQMDGFFDEYGLKRDDKLNSTITYYKGSDKDISKIRKTVTDQVKNLKIPQKDKDIIIDRFDEIVLEKSNLTSILDDVLRKRGNLLRKLKDDYYSTVTDWLYPFVEQNQANISKDLQVTKEDFKNQLQQAQQDVGLGTYGLASLSTVNDPIAQAIRLSAEQDRHDAHLKTIQDQYQMSSAMNSQYGDQGIQLDKYNDYLKTVSREIRKTDEEGNIVYDTLTTKAIITEFKTEDLERDRNIEFKRLTEYFTKIEDDKISKLEQKISVEGLTDKERETRLAAFEKAKEDKDWNIIQARQKAMSAWYETKYDIKSKTDIIRKKQKELSTDDFKLWYTNQIYQRTIPASELDFHKRTRAKFRMIHPERLDSLNSNTVQNSNYYREGRKENGKVVEYYIYEIFYGGDFTQPKEEYRDPKFLELSKDKFFKQLSETYHKTNNLLSGKHKLKHGTIPQIEKSVSTWDKNKTASDNVKKMWSNMTPDILAEANEHEIEQDGVLMKVSNVSQNVDGTIIKTIPVKFVSLLQDPQMLDTNLIETFTKFSAVVNRYNNMSRTDASARALKNLIAGNPELSIKAREVLLTDAKGNKALTKIQNTASEVLKFAVKEKGVRLNDLIVDFIDDTWYGDTGEKESINLGGKDLSLDKLSNLTSKWVSIQRLAGNLDSAISNLIIGKLAIFQESLAGKFYTKSDYYEASKTINKELYDGTVINDYMQTDINKKSKYAQMMIHFDAIQGEFSNEYGIKISKKTASEMGKDFLFFSQNGMEYTIQKRSMLCVAKGYKVNLPDGLIYDKKTDELREATSEELKATEQVRSEIRAKYQKLIDKQSKEIEEQNNLKPTTKVEIDKVAKTMSKMRRDLENISTRMENELSNTATNYFTGLDAYTQDETGALKVKDFLAPYFTKNEENKLRRRIQELNKRQQGIYAQFDKSQAQRHWLGRLALMFRKYLYSAYDHRFGERKANLALGQETYGYQRQFLNKFLNDYQTYGTWAFSKLVDGSATQEEQYAINKTLIEYATWASFMVLFLLLRSLQDDDDEKNWAISKTAFIVKRTEDSLSEFTLPFGIGTLVRTFKNPFAQLALVEQIYELFAVIFDDPFGEYERDSGVNKKGDSKVLGKFLKIAPVLRQYGKFMTPEDQLKFYTQKKTNV